MFSGLRPGQHAAEKDGSIHREFFRWLSSLVSYANQTTVPPKGIVMCNLSAADIAAYFDATGLGLERKPYEGWALCNGSNDTPNLASKFVRASLTASGGTGGSDSSAHTHSVTHDHASFTSGAESSHTHAAGSLVADFSARTAAISNYKSAAGSFTADVELTVNAANVSQACTNTMAVEGTSAAGSSHTHSVDVPSSTVTSGAASASDNMPAYYELVPLMRVLA